MGGGGSANDPYQAKRREMELKREQDLDRIETDYQEERKQVAAARGKQLENIVESQEKEIARTRSDVDHKIATQKAHADGQLKKYQDDTIRVTEEAGKAFRDKAAKLSQIQKEMEGQQHQMNLRYSEAAKEKQRAHEETMALNKSRAERDMGLLGNTADNRIKELSKRNSDEVNRLEAEQKSHIAKVRYDGNQELGYLKSNHKRLAEELQEEIAFEKNRQRATLDDSRKLFTSQYENQQSTQVGELDESRRNYDRSMRNLHQDGERGLASLRNHYIDEKRKVSVDGDKTLRDSSDKAFKQKTLIEQQLADDLKRTERNYYKRRQDMDEQERIFMNTKTAQAEGYRAKTEKDYLDQNKIIRDKRESTIKELYATMGTDLKNISDKSNKEFELLKKESAERVANHHTKSADPFYRLHDMGTKVSESEKGFLLSIPMPEHEKDSVNITSNLHGVTVSGNRRSEVKAKDTDRMITTNSYQSYSETIALPSKVNLKGMTKTYDSGALHFYIPKA